LSGRWDAAEATLDFARVLDMVAQFLDVGGFRYGVVGSLGLHAYGIDRATADVDLVVDEQAQRPLVARLESLGYETLQVSAGYSNHVHPLPAMGRLDFIYLDAPTADLLFAAGTRLVLPGVRAVAVPRPEHLAALKVLAMKNDPSRTLREMADIQALLELPGVDENEIRGYFEQHGLRERFDDIRRAMGSDDH